MSKTEHIDKLTQLLDDIKYHHTRLYEKHVKKSCTCMRRALQDMAVLCKDMRKCALDHKKSLPVKKRPPKEEPENVSPEEEEKKDTPEV